ncbi:MAG: hypothetical protein OQJ89_01915, partial [Kangiellaceae bacterium]|nr:hypothetical protein [Kangiellaceae bacterium]
MNSATVIIVILVIIVACVVAITVIQKREEEKAKVRQKIAQHKYRANQASTILGNFSQLPIGAEARQILMTYCLANMKAIRQLSPFDQNIKKNIDSLQQNLKTPQTAADSQKLTIPNDLTLLTQQVNQLSTLAKFILKINKSNLVPANTAAIAVRKIMGLISESKICAYIQQGKESLSKHEYVPAQRNFIMAQQMMIKLPDKNERLKKLEVELQELIKSSPTEAMNTELSFDQPSAENSEEPKKPDDLFGPR